MKYKLALVALLVSMFGVVGCGLFDNEPDVIEVEPEVTEEVQEDEVLIEGDEGTDINEIDEDVELEFEEDLEEEEEEGYGSDLEDKI